MSTSDPMNPKAGDVFHGYHVVEVFARPHRGRISTQIRYWRDEYGSDYRPCVSLTEWRKWMRAATDTPPAAPPQTQK